MDFFEKDLEDIICDALKTKEGQESLYDRGLEFTYSSGHLKFKRQLNLGAYGTCDIIISSKDDTDIHPDFIMQDSLTIEVMELKKGELDVNALTQVMRYVRGVERYMKKHHPKMRYNVIPTLVGKSIDLRDWVYMIEKVEGLRVFTYEYRMDGIRFVEQSDYQSVGDNY
jgi:hypothetical protein